MNRFTNFLKSIHKIWFTYLLWVVTSLPLVTIGASTTACFYTLMQIDRNKLDGGVAQNFFKSFKENFKMSTMIWAIFASIGAILAVGFVFAYGSGAGTTAGKVVKVLCYIFGTPIAISLTFVFGVQARFTNTFVDTVMYSFSLALKNFASTLAIAAVVGISVYGCLVIPYLVYVYAAGFAGICMFSFACYYDNVFSVYLPKEYRNERENKRVENAESRFEIKMQEKKEKEDEQEKKAARPKRSMADIIDATSNEAED